MVCMYFHLLLHCAWYMYTCAEGEHVATYEQVTLEPRGYARPVIILGALKEDINDMLVQEFPDKFAGCVPRKSCALCTPFFHVHE